MQKCRFVNGQILGFKAKDSFHTQKKIPIRVGMGIEYFGGEFHVTKLP
jgi:hypothetical protein